MTLEGKEKSIFRNLGEVFSKSLIICAHADDEIACAGTISRLREQGSHIKYVLLSRRNLYDKSTPDEFLQGDLDKENDRALETLGITDKVVVDFPNRNLFKFRAEILDLFSKIKVEYSPDLVICPATTDIHQDHQVASMEAFRAFKQTTVLGMDMPHNISEFKLAGFVALSEKNLTDKLKVCSCYTSQQFRRFLTAKFSRSLAEVRGMQSGCKHAEAYEIIRMIL